MSIKTFSVIFLHFLENRDIMESLNLKRIMSGGMFRQGGIKMKAQTLIFTICVVSLFIACSKKQSVSKIEIAPSVPAETVSVQTKIPESSSKDVVFSEEDKIAIRDMKRHIRMLSANNLVESKPMGTYELYYGNTERVWAPVTSITNTDLERMGNARIPMFDC